MFLQFELWKECPNNCSFCYNKGIPFKRDKIKSMLFAKNKLLSEEADNYDHIGFIMGEAFSGQIRTKEEHDLFYELIDILIDKLKNNKIKKAYITASLIYKDLTDWFEFCTHLKEKDALKDFLICTSYDTIGRFDGSKLALWKNTIRKTKELFNDIEFHIETIITEDFLKSVLDNSFNIREFEKEYDCRIDYIVPFVGYGKLYKTKQELQERLPNFFPKRETFYAFLQYVYENNIFTIQDLKDFININLHSDRAYQSYNDIDIELVDNRHTNEDKHCIIGNELSGYIDSDIHPRQDVETFINLVGG